MTGKLDRPGYTVMAVGYRGRVVSTSARSFRLRLPERRATLHLISPNGTYGGPIVVGERGRHVIVGVRAGARLGLVRVGRGHGRVARPMPGRWIDRGRVAFARRGVPLGNGRNFGFVRTTRHRGPNGRGADADLDGVPNVLDVAVSGRLVLNALASSGTGGPRSRAAATDPPPPPPGDGPGAPPPGGEARGPPPGGSPQAPPARSPWMSQIFLDIPRTLNANAAGVTRAQIDAMLVDRLNMKYLSVPRGDVVELDCHGLTYCSPGGSGRAVTNNVFPGPGRGGPAPETVPFPGCCDRDDDALGALRGPGAVPLAQESQGDVFVINPRATSAEIGTGDLMTLVVADGGVTTDVPAPLDFLFVTVPALRRYDDGEGHALTVAYPAAEDVLGTQANPAPVSAGPDGEVVVDLSWWRPQRSGIEGAGEPAFMDVGRLVYGLDVPPQPPFATPAAGGGGAPQCSAASITTNDPDLTLKGRHDPTGVAAGELVDDSADAPASPARTLEATLNLTRCLRDKGAAEWPVGTTIQFELEASTQGSSDHANQAIWFQRVG